MRKKSLHVVIWLPSTFYSAVAATIVEILELVNTLKRSTVFTFEFISESPEAVSTTGISFVTKPCASKAMDVLILLATPGLDVPELLKSLHAEAPNAKRQIQLARQQGAIIAAHCGAGYYLADAGMLDGKRATISWWLKAAMARRFPKVRWETSQMLVREGSIYTCGGGFSGLELVKTLLEDLGLIDEARVVRKLLVLPPARKYQTPYTFSLEEITSEPGSFVRNLRELAKEELTSLSLPFLANKLNMSQRTLSRRFEDELHISPGRWIQDLRIENARNLLERSSLSVAEICFRVGYEDVASFGRLFSKVTGMSPGEYRRQV